MHCNSLSHVLPCTHFLLPKTDHLLVTFPRPLLFHPPPSLPKKWKLGKNWAGADYKGSRPEENRNGERALATEVVTAGHSPSLSLSLSVSLYLSLSHTHIQTQTQTHTHTQAQRLRQNDVVGHSPGGCHALHDPLHGRPVLPHLRAATAGRPGGRPRHST